MVEIIKALWPYLVGLFLIDCISYVDRHQQLFVSFWGRRLHLKKCGWRTFGLLPTGLSFSTSNLPIVLTTRGVYFPKDPRFPEKVVYRSGDFHFVPYDKIENIRMEGKELYINGAPVLKTVSSLMAKSIARPLKELVSLSADKRSKKIKSFLRERIFAPNLKATLDDYQSYLTHLKILCSLLFALTFVVLPLISYTQLYLFAPLNILLVGMLGVYLLIIIFTYTTHRKMFPEESLDRTYVLFSIILSPVAALHAIHYLTKHFSAACHFAPVAAEFMTAGHFEEDIRKEILVATYSKKGNSDPEWSLFWNQQARMLRKLAASKGVSIAKLMAPRERQDGSALCYCPFCRTEYRSFIPKCHDCNVDMVAYNDAEGLGKK